MSRDGADRDGHTCSWAEMSYTDTGNHRNNHTVSAKQQCALPPHERRNGGGDGAVAGLHRVNAVARHATVERGVHKYLHSLCVNDRIMI
jgi:hypothetical protein